LLAANTDPTNVQTRFEKQAEIATKTLTDLSSRLPTAAVRIVVLGKPDPGRRSVLFSERFTIRQFAAAARIWTDAQLAAPAFQASFPKGKPAGVVINSYVCHPGDLVKLLNTTWLRGLEERKFVPTCRLNQAYALLLGSLAEQRRVAASKP